MFCWSVFIQGFWVTRTYLWERFLFLGLAFLLVNPSHVMLGSVTLNQHLVNLAAVGAMVSIYLWQQSRRRKARLAAEGA
jgi:TRAP-type uncharacterized transport system fused permease subunit